ncbi:related to short chain oxidoreductase/dehydrogenase [Phialocephala subalpina]|uniref:Related to short chain oxidoreductase/dehydrogenase n=1 Tax=Phialocephala subalpina TaxID=576137 RepID=A0A1L7XD76_9HELO|nr:related to short chain oxidoreductase/dehydrogenase [Phialocephala subalpina]
MPSSKVWLITGSNTGLGLELALKALKEGDKVIAAMRTPSKCPPFLKDNANVSILPFDLSWTQDTITSAMKTAVDAFGHIDILVNNAGYAYLGAIEESTDEETKTQFEINVFGVLRTIRAALPYLRAQRSGTIVNLSSVGGFHSFPANGLYCATKFALEGITEALAAEVSPFGIRALIVEPGYFRTAFLANPTAGMNVTTPIKDYDGTTAHEAAANIEKYNGKQLGNPVLGAQRIWEVVRGEGMAKGKKELLRLPLGSDCGTMMRGYAEDLRETADEYEEIWRSTDFVE